MEEGNAKTLLLDDIPILTFESAEEAALAAAPADIRFSFGSKTIPAMREQNHAPCCGPGTAPDVIDDIGHFLYYYPDTVAGYTLRAEVTVLTPSVGGSGNGVGARFGLCGDIAHAKARFFLVTTSLVGPTLTCMTECRRMLSLVEG